MPRKSSSKKNKQRRSSTAAANKQDYDVAFSQQQQQQRYYEEDPSIGISNNNSAMNTTSSTDAFKRDVDQNIEMFFSNPENTAVNQQLAARISGTTLPKNLIYIVAGLSLIPIICFIVNCLYFFEDDMKKNRLNNDDMHPAGAYIVNGVSIAVWVVIFSLFSVAVAQNDNVSLSDKVVFILCWTFVSIIMISVITSDNILAITYVALKDSKNDHHFGNNNNSSDLLNRIRNRSSAAADGSKVDKKDLNILRWVAFSVGVFMVILSCIKLFRIGYAIQHN